MVIYDREKKELIIPSGLGNIQFGQSSGGGDYEQGYADGKQAQKSIDDSLLENGNITSNGIYVPTYGYKYIEVRVPMNQGYNEGYADGRREGVTEGMHIQKDQDDAKLTDSINITENGTYNADYGYKEVVVNVPQGKDYEDGLSDGKTQQKAEDDAKLTDSINITENGVYDADYGFKRVIVNVPIIEKDHILSYETDDNSFIPIYYKDRSLEGEIVASLKGQVWFKGDVGDLRIFMGENNPTRNMTSVIVPESTTKLSYSFYNCNKLASIDLPSTMELFHITYPLSSLNTIICRATTAPTLVMPQGSAVAENGVLKVPSGSDYSSWLNILPSGWTIQSIE